MNWGYYDRQGKPQDPATFRSGETANERRDYKRIGDFENRHLRVSTVWLGHDHNFDGSGPPLIFETMVFAHGEAFDQYGWRYSTEENALAGHTRVVAFFSNPANLAALRLGADMPEFGAR